MAEADLVGFFKAADIESITGGRWLSRSARNGSAPTGVAIDSRARDLRGSVFVAIAGQNHDGHDHVAAALLGGADLAIVQRPVPDAPPGSGVLLVPDTRRALGALAAAWREDALARTKVIAVTGSAGKTTVKTLLHAVLSRRLTGSCAPKSFNNAIGVPLTILGAAPGQDFLVLEIGANHPGEVEALAAIALPDVAVITMVGRAHLEGFGSIEVVAHEKAGLLRGRRPGALAVAPADSVPLRPHLAGVAPLVTFGADRSAALRLAAHRRDGRGWRFQLEGGRGFRLGLPGRHNAVNALAVVAVARHLGIDDATIDAALAECRPVEMRLSRREVGGITLWNDAYNANPESMAAALETFSELASGAGARRRIVVLGDMLELGESGPALHRDLARAILAAGADRAVLVGSLAREAAAGLAAAWGPSGDDRVQCLDDLGEAEAELIAATLEPGDHVLLKGSRSMKLERLVPALARCTA